MAGGGSTSTTTNPSSGTDGTATSGSVIASGTVYGTYYYDQRITCPQDPNGYSESTAITSCESYAPGPNQLHMNQRATNNIIAIGQLANHPSPATRTQFCGKQVLITYKGQRVAAPDGGDWFIWDGCLDCANNVDGGRIDFSVSGLRQMDSSACSNGKVAGVSYQITTKQVLAFVA